MVSWASVSLPIFPSSMAFFIRRQAGNQRRWLITESTLPAFREAAIMSSHWAAVRAIGFSTSTCRPAANDSIVPSRCWGMGSWNDHRFRPVSRAYLAVAIQSNSQFFFSHGSGARFFLKLFSFFEPISTQATTGFANTQAIESRAGLAPSRD